MTVQHDPNTGRGDRGLHGLYRATRRREGLGTMLAVVVISGLVIAGLSLVIDPPPSTGTTPQTPPATYRAQ
jgi:hypothetical protein